MAASAYSANGWSVEEGYDDTRALARFFARKFGAPERTIVYGMSLGSLIALRTAEKPAETFDGAICFCGPVAGAPLTWDAVFDFALAYDVAFGWPASWGAPENVRDDLDFESEVVPVLLEQLGNASSAARMEFVRIAAHLPAEGFYDGKSPLPWLFMMSYFATEGRAELEERSGGVFVQNADHRYVPTIAEREYLRKLGLDPAELFARLRNTRRRIEGKRAAREYVRRHYEPTGRLRIPVLTVHNVVDGLVPAAHESVLRQVARDARRSHYLAQAFAEQTGHCAFTAEQFFAAVEAMERWIDTGSRPDGEDFLPRLGFVAGFEPEPWPQPIGR